MRVIDAHVHVWDPALVRYPWLDPASPLHRRFDLDELEDEARDAGVDGVVLVQAADSTDDTEYLLAVADRHPLVAGVVGWIPLDAPREAGERLDALAEHPRLAGVRNLTHDRPDPRWLLRDDVSETLSLVAERGIPLDVVTNAPEGLEVVAEVIERHPDLDVVIDHLGKPRPDADHEAFARWRALLARCAAGERVTAKVSGIPIGGTDAAGHRRIVETAIELFGAERLMAGSDWPITTSTGGIGALWTTLGSALAELGADERAAVCGGTAERIYRLEPHTTS